jgi:hypothetical protein
VAVEQQVLGLQVAVDDVVRVQVVEGQRDLGGVELGDGVREALRLAQQAEQLAALDKVHDHVQVLGVLEGAPQGDQERVLDLLQHAALVVGVLDLLHLDDLGLLQHLDGVEALVVLALHEVHAAEAAGAERALDLEVGERVLALGDARGVEWLRGELHGAVLGRGGGVGRVYQVLDAGRVVRGRRRVRALRLRRRVLRGVHRVGRLVLGRGRLGRVVRLRLMEVERARGALRGRRRQRRRAVDGRRRAVELVGALRVLRPLLLEEAEGRHGSGPECELLLPWRCARRGRLQQRREECAASGRAATQTAAIGDEGAGGERRAHASGGWGVAMGRARAEEGWRLVLAGRGEAHAAAILKERSSAGLHLPWPPAARALHRSQDHREKHIYTVHYLPNAARYAAIPLVAVLARSSQLRHGLSSRIPGLAGLLAASHISIPKPGALCMRTVLDLDTPPAPTVPSRGVSIALRARHHRTSMRRIGPRLGSLAMPLMLTAPLRPSQRRARRAPRACTRDPARTRPSAAGESPRTAGSTPPRPLCSWAAA